MFADVCKGGAGGWGVGGGGGGGGGAVFHDPDSHRGSERGQSVGGGTSVIDQ